MQYVYLFIYAWVYENEHAIHTNGKSIYRQKYFLNIFDNNFVCKRPTFTQFYVWFPFPNILLSGCCRILLFFDIFFYFILWHHTKFYRTKQRSRFFLSLSVSVECLCLCLCWRCCQIHEKFTVPPFHISVIVIVSANKVHRG